MSFISKLAPSVQNTIASIWQRFPKKKIGRAGQFLFDHAGDIYDTGKKAYNIKQFYGNFGPKLLISNPPNYVPSQPPWLSLTKVPHQPVDLSIKPREFLPPFWVRVQFYRAEVKVYSHWIGEKLVNADDQANYLPIDPERDDLYKKCKDGVLYCKLIKIIRPKYGDLVISGPITFTLFCARAMAFEIGCHITDLDVSSLEAANPLTVVKLIGRIILASFVDNRNIRTSLAVIRGKDIDIKEFIPLENFLIEWTNYKLEKADYEGRINNLGKDLKDSKVFIQLLRNELAQDSGVNVVGLENLENDRERAERVIAEAQNIGCGVIMSPEDILSGNPRLNAIMLASIYRMCPVNNQ